MRDWEPAKGSFDAFAYLCARRQAITAVVTARRAKHQVLNLAASTDQPLSDEDDMSLTLGDVLADLRSDVSRKVIAREQAAALVARLRELTDWERECVVRCLINGEPYQNVGEYKSVDNAIQRAKLHLAVPGDRLRSRLRSTGQPTWAIDPDIAA